MPIPVVPGNDIRFRRLNLSQGLSQTRVAQIVQDNQGFVWFGTQHGLNRFDGYNYRVFKHEVGVPDSLSGVFIYALFKDSTGRLWVGSDQGVDVYDASSETFRHVNLGRPDPMVIHISETGDGMLWFATGQGLYGLEPATGKQLRFGHDPENPRSLPSDDIKSSGEDRTGTFWVASKAGLSAFERATGRVTLHIPLKESVREFSFHEDRHGSFWIIYGSGNGLALFDRKTNLLTRYRFTARELVDTSLTGVYAILESRDGTIWLGTMGAGLLRYDRAQQRFVSYGNQPTNLESLAENRVIALSEDLEGNIWVGLHASPPNLFPRVAPPFERMKPTSAHANSLGETLVNAIFEDSRGRLWVGAGGALNRVNRETGDFDVIESLGDGAPIEVLTILEDQAGSIWIGSLGTGLYRMDGENGQVVNFRHDPNDSGSISSDLVTRLFIDRSGTMWAATWDGLARRDAGSGRFTTYKRNPGSSIEAYFSIAEDGNGVLWLGSTTGLHRFDPETGRFTSFTHDIADPRTLSNNTVNTVLAARSGEIWVGTQNGLNRLDPASQTFTILSQRDGLPGNVISCILEDGAGDLWMSTNNGIARMRVSTQTFTHYSTADGLPGGDLTGWNACHRSATGEMFFGGFAGATAILPERLKEDAYVPPVVLTELRLAGKAVAPTTPPLHRSITHTDTLTLTPSQNDFAIGFSALGFGSPETNRYRYKMIGLDTDWQVVGGDRRTVSYTTLPAGRYRFEVQAATSRGAWTLPGRGIDIEILPPWQESWWFRIGYITAFVLLLVGLYRYRVRQVAHSYQIRMDERVNERTRIARELHDSLLQGFQGLMFRLQAVRDLLPDEPRRAMEQLDIALDRADRATLEGREAVNDLRTPSLKDADLAHSLKSLEDEFGPVSSGTAPTLEVVVEGRARALSAVVRDEAYRIAREAVRNAFRHAEATRVECELMYGERQFRLRIRDNGRGIDPSVVRAGTRAGHWGLSGMRERSERLGGRLTVWSAKNSGTEIELGVPARIAYLR